ncbi:flagellar brake protein [candidate division KSB1 bacterium]
MDESWGPILQLFKIPPASTEAAIAFILFMGLIIFASIAVHVAIYIKHRNKINLEKWDWFYRMCEAKDLSVQEMKLLRTIIKKCKIKNPVSIFTSIRLFDKCVIKEFKRLNLNENDKEEFADEISELRKKLHFDRFPPSDILNSTRGIPPNQRIRVELDMNGKKGYFRSKVLEVKEDSITILMPKRERFKNYLKEGQPAEIYFWRFADGGYTFSTTITKVEEEEPGVLYIEHSDKIKRSQRRHYFRIYVSYPLYFRPLSIEQRSEILVNRHIQFPKNIKPHPARITSLSGGGVSFITDTTFPSGQILWLEIGLTGYQNIADIYGRVIRSKKIDEDKFKLFVEFVLIPDKERELILGFVAARQRERITA